ncbi:MAG TPA: hypothetical protein VGL56_18395 [Fimbriimonadaceae bacterium]|jgi:hypothetical protein
MNLTTAHDKAMFKEKATLTTYLKLGQTVITRAAQEKLHAADVSASLRRHERGDWGDVSSEDRKANDWSLENGERILSGYRDRNGTKFWIITERDRSATTVLLPEDY